MAIKGEKLFKSNCGACHSLDAYIVGPPLRGVLNREPYNGDVAKVSRWIKNTAQLAFTDPYYKSLKEKSGGVIMPPQALPDEEIKAILEYLSGAPLPKSM